MSFSEISYDQQSQSQIQFQQQESYQNQSFKLLGDLTFNSLQENADKNPNAACEGKDQQQDKQQQQQKQSQPQFNKQESELSILGISGIQYQNNIVKDNDDSINNNLNEQEQQSKQLEQIQNQYFESSNISHDKKPIIKATSRSVFTTNISDIGEKIYDEGIIYYVCKQCGLAFKTSTSLRSHNARYHGGEKPFECPICGKRFSRKDNYNIHMTREALKSGNVQKQFECPVCYKQFLTQAEYIRHLQIHNKNEK